MINVDWATFKSVVTGQNLTFKYVTLDNNYYMYTENASPIACHVEITNPANSDQTDFETNLKSKGNRSEAVTIAPFADKVLPNGKRLYTRVHGIQASVSGAPDTIDFNIPYNNCKLTGIEILNGLTGDTCNLKVIDTPSGTISGVPNAVLNQFGFDVNVNKDYYKRESAYDADLIKDMKIRVEYDSIATLPANIYLNFILHEVKD